MSSSRFSFIILATIALALMLGVQEIVGEITCEKLEQESCAFSVSSTGKRCVLEKGVKRSGFEVYSCRSSGIDADSNLKGYIETDHCINSCGLDRNSLGISSDCLLEPHFSEKLCSTPCYEYCPNIVDLFFNLAAGEGVFLPKLCNAQKQDARRGMAEIRSSGSVALGPVQPVKFTAAPAMAPYYY